MRVVFVVDEGAQPRAAALASAHADALNARGVEAIVVPPDEYVRGDDDSVVGVAELRSLGFIVADEFFRETLPRENAPLRVLLAGESQDEATAVDDGYGAAAHARWFHQEFDLVRLAAWAPSREEPLDSVQEFHVALTSAERRRLLHSCDVIIAPAITLETAEALASGLAVVRAEREHDPVSLGERLIEVLSDAEVRATLRSEGREKARQWLPANVGRRVDELLRPSSRA